jgi:uncharacterized protein (TIGR00369 family)
MGNMVPLVGTTGLLVEEMTEGRVAVVARNRRRVRNHIGSVHAAAVALAAETATGFVTAMNVGQDQVVLLKTMRVDFKKRIRGDVRAVATLTEEQRGAIRGEERGRLPVEVHVTDGSGEEPVACEMVWAWVPRS